MAYGFGGGMGLGLAAGANAGTNMAEARTRREALMKEQFNQKITQAQELVEGGLTNLAETVAKLPQRTPDVDQMVQSRLDMLRQTSQMIAQLPGGETISKALQAQIETVAPSIKTASEIQTQEVMLARQKMADINGSGSMPGMPAASPGPTTSAPLPPMQNTSPSGMQPQMFGQPGPGASPAGMPAAMSPPPAPAQVAQNTLSDQYQLGAELGIENPRAKGFLEEEGKLAAQQKDELGKSVADEIGTAKQMFDLSKDMFTGKSAWWDELTAGVGSVLDMNTPDGQRQLVNTQRYHQLARKLVGYVIKQYGSGTGLSDADFANALMQAAGDVSFTKEALQGSLRSLVGARIDQINQYNQNNPYSQIAIPPEYKEFVEQPGGQLDIPYDMQAIQAIHAEFKAKVAEGTPPEQAFAEAQEAFASATSGESAGGITTAPEQIMNGIRRYNPETGKIE